MASEREEAKAAIDETDEPDFSGPLDAGIRLRQLVESNKHALSMAAGQRGWFGHLFGDKDHAPVVIAFIITCIGLFIGFWCLIRASHNHADAEFWSKQSHRAFALAGSALGFIFGKGSGK